MKFVEKSRRILTRLFACALAALLCVLADGTLTEPAAAQSPPGVKTDRGVYPIPSPLPPLPAVNAQFTDPVFGTQLIRATDASDCPAPGCSTYYSHWPTFNSNNTYILFRNGGGSGDGVIKEFNPASFTVGARHRPGTIYVPGEGGVVMQFESAVWHPTDPHLIYCFPNSYGAPTPMGLYTYNVLQQRYSGAVDSPAPIRNFNSFRVQSTDYLSQMSMSADGTVFAFNIRRLGSGDLPIAYLIWNKISDQVIYTPIPAQDVNEVRVDKSGRYLTIGKQFPECATNNPPCEFVKARVLNIATGWIDDIRWNSSDRPSGHGDVGTGKMAGFDPWQGGMNTRRLDILHTGIVTAFDWKTNAAHPAGPGHTDWTKDFHGSLLGDDEDWMTVGTILSYDALFPKPPAPPSPPPAPFQDYGILTNEIAQVSLDGSQRIRRLAHTYSVMAALEEFSRQASGIPSKPSNGYYSAPKPTISKDGRFIAYTSNWGNSDRYDLFILKNPMLNAPTNLRFVDAQPGNPSHLSWNDNSNDETGFVIESRKGAGWSAWGLWSQVTVGANVTTYNSAPVVLVQYRVKAINESGYSAYSNAVDVNSEAIFWTNISGAIVSGSGLTPNAAGGRGETTQSITSGNGSVKFTVAVGGDIGFAHVGLINNAFTGSTAEFDYSWRLYNGLAVCHANGDNISGGFPLADGDTFEVKINGTTVEYYRNGAMVFSIAGQTLAYPYRAAVVFSDTTSPRITSLQILTPPNGDVTWTSLVGANASGSNLTPTASNGRGESVQSLTSGNGGLKVTTPFGGDMGFAHFGLINNAFTGSTAEFDYSWRLYNGLAVCHANGDNVSGGFSAASGDTFEVRINGTTVEWYRNGAQVFSLQGQTLSYPYRAAAVFSDTTSPRMTNALLQ